VFSSCEEEPKEKAEKLIYALMRDKLDSKLIERFVGSGDLI
jgi:hypothetical protein